MLPIRFVALAPDSDLLPICVEFRHKMEDLYETHALALLKPLKLYNSFGCYRRVKVGNVYDIK